MWIFYRKSNRDSLKIFNYTLNTTSCDNEVSNKISDVSLLC